MTLPTLRPQACSPPVQALTDQATTGPHASLRPYVRRFCVAALAALLLAAPTRSRAQDAGASLEEALEAGESPVESPRRLLVRWNEYDGHLSDNLRFELAYGYGTLDRFDLVGTTQFFQSRIQLQF